MVRYGALTATLLLLSLAGCGKAKDRSAPAAATEAPAKPIAFAACAACHSVSAGHHGIGPSLAGVFGRKAGSLPGFDYSAAMKRSGKVWDEAALDNFLTSPMAAVPGTRMSYMGQTDPAKRKALIEYLKTLK
jgi:cytochrome c